MGLALKGLTLKGIADRNGDSATMSDLLPVRCPHCDATQHLPRDYVGKSVICIACGKEYVAQAKAIVPSDVPVLEEGKKYELEASSPSESQQAAPGPAGAAEWQCSYCAARVPADMAACQYCGTTKLGARGPVMGGGRHLDPADASGGRDLQLASLAQVVALVLCSLRATGVLLMLALAMRRAPIVVVDLPQGLIGAYLFWRVWDGAMPLWRALVANVGLVLMSAGLVAATLGIFFHGGWWLIVLGAGLMITGIVTVGAAFLA